MNRVTSSLSAWTIQTISLLGVVGWMVCDPKLELLIERIQLGTGSPIASLSDAAAYVGWLRPTILVAMVLVVLTNLSLLLAGMLRRTSGSTRLRSVRSMLTYTAVLAIWFSLAINVSAIAWHSKRVRLAWRIDDLEKIAAPLRMDWPSQDGELSNIGPFMAYPLDKPSTLILLNPREVCGSQLFLSAVERAENGAIRFQLSGVDQADWAEWHPESSRPRTFTGGLSDRHELEASIKLGDGWYLARYQS